MQIEINRNFKSNNNENKDTDVKLDIYEQTIVTGSKHNRDEEKYVCSEKLYTGVNESSQHTEINDLQHNKISFSLFNLEAAS